MEPTTVADDLAVFHLPTPDGGVEVRRYEGLAPATTHRVDGLAFRTLPRPPGERLATVATVNDVHIGEVECGRIEGVDIGPVLRCEPGEEPYPEVMSRAAVAEIAALAPDAVVVKGDLTREGTEAEEARFRELWEPAFGERLHCVRGNHDVATGRTFAADAPFAVPLPGVVLAVLDTAVPGAAGGRVGDDQLAWLDDLGARADRPVLVFGHHHPEKPGSAARDGGWFGIRPDDSQRLVDVVARRPALVGWFCGHTHRNRVRRFPATGEVPWVEVASLKDFPGVWAEYRVFEGGGLQVLHRVSDPRALAWTERTRAMFAGQYAGYAYGGLDDRCFPVPPRPGGPGRPWEAP